MSRRRPSTKGWFEFQTNAARLAAALAGARACIQFSTSAPERRQDSCARRRPWRQGRVSQTTGTQPFGADLRAVKRGGRRNHVEVRPEGSRSTLAGRMDVSRRPPCSGKRHWRRPPDPSGDCTELALVNRTGRACTIRDDAARYGEAWRRLSTVPARCACPRERVPVATFALRIPFTPRKRIRGHRRRRGRLRPRPAAFLRRTASSSDPHRTSPTGLSSRS